MLRPIETYYQFGQSQIGKISARYNSGDHNCYLLIEIENGPQAGSIVNINHTNFSIGGELDDDVFLVCGSDDYRPVKIRVAHSILGSLVTLETERTDLIVKNTAYPGSPITERLPCEITIGEATLCIKEESTFIENDERKLSIPVFFGMILIAALALQLVIISVKPESNTITRLAPVQNVDELSIESNIDDARQVLARLGLDESVTLTFKNSTLTFTGSLDKTQGQIWLDAKPELDSMLSSIATLNLVRIANDPPRIPAISMVVTEPVQFLQLIDGRRIRPGEELTPNAVLVTINERSFDIKFGTETLNVSF